MTSKKIVTETELSFPSMTRALLFLSLLTPLVYWPYLYYYSSSSKVYFFLAIAELALLCFVWSAWRSPKWRPRFTALGLLVLSFIGVQLFSGLIGENVLLSFWGSASRSTSLLVWLHLGALFTITIGMVHSSKQWKTIFEVSVYTAIVVSLIFLLSLAFPEATALFSRSKGGSTLGNSSFFGTYLLFQISFGAFLVLTEKMKNRRLLWMVATGLLSLALFLTTAQAAQFAFFGGCILFLALFLFSDQENRLKRISGAILLLSLAGTFMVLWFLLLQPGSQVRQAVVDRSGETRFILWNIAWQGILERPLFGWGPENYQDVFQKYYNPCLGSPACGGEVWFDRAHNKVLDVFVESGIVGLGFYLSLFVLGTMNLWQAMRRHRVSRSVFALFTSVLLAYFVQNLTVFDTLTSLYFFLLLLAFISFVVRPETESSTGDDGRAANGHLPLVASLVTLLLPFLFYWFVVSPVRANIATSEAAQATLFSERISAYEEAVTRSFQGIDLRRSMLAAQTATVILDLEDEAAARLEASFTRELLLSEQGLRDTIQHSPFFLRAYLDLAFVYQIWGRTFEQEKYQEAEVILLQAISRFPKNPLPYWGLVGLSLDQGKNEDALRLAEQALALDQQVRTSQLRYLLTLKMAGEAQRLGTTLETFALLDPTVSLTIEPYLRMDTSQKEQKESLLFRFYYDASF
ncbi:O-antigen ligase family protein [Candidatus Uhrbacteria bacterium]|nr:O-antigen ligase family protein [Candidatus Uhrbacteria bacterium]